MKKGSPASPPAWLLRLKLGTQWLASYLSLAAGAFALVWLGLRQDAEATVHIPAWEPEQRPLVILDAGHGGHDGGAVAGEILEKNLALTLTLQLRDELLHQGLRVKMTRETDVFLPLEERAALADASGAAAFVSIHLNTSSSPEVRGIETYYNEQKALSAQRALQARWALPAGAVQDRRGRWLADCLQRHVCLTTGAESRGIKQKNYAVVSQTHIPAALVECGFLTHPAEKRSLTETTYQQKLVRGLAAGLSSFLKGHLPSPSHGVQANPAFPLPAPGEAAVPENAP